ncbi:MAG: hypothetical protein ACRYFS_04660 [Janthinobacterium lividum]
MDIRQERPRLEKSALDEIREALDEIRSHQGTSAPICSARVRYPDELQETLQRSNWAFTPFTPNPSNRFEPRPQGLSEANRDAARQANYVGQVLGMPILADQNTAPGMLCVYDYAGSLVREIIINQGTYDTWAKEQGYWRKADEVGIFEDVVSATHDETAPHLSLESIDDPLTEIPVYGLWRDNGWARWASGELINSPYIRVLRATLRGIDWGSSLENAVICEIAEDGSCGSPVTSAAGSKPAQAKARNIHSALSLGDKLGQRLADGR